MSQKKCEKSPLMRHGFLAILYMFLDMLKIEPVAIYNRQDMLLALENIGLLVAFLD